MADRSSSTSRSERARAKTGRASNFRKVTMSPRLEALARECHGIERGLGNRLTEILLRYDALTARYNPRHLFSDDDWRTVVEVIGERMRRRWREADGMILARTLADLLGAAGHYALAREVGSLEPAESTALIEAVYQQLIQEATSELDAPA